MGQPEREREREREKRQNYPTKSPKLRQCQDGSQNKGWSKYQRKASRLRTGPSTAADKQAEGNHSHKDTIRASERHPVPNCKQASLLTKPSWDFGWLTFTERFTARDQLLRRDTRHTREGMPIVHPGNRAAGTGEALRHTPHPTHTPWGDCACQAPGHLSFSDLGLAQRAGPTKSAPLWRTREPEPERLRHGKCMQPRARIRPFRQSNLEPEQCSLGKHTGCEPGQTQCGWITASTPPTHQWYLFAAFLPPHTH